MHKQAPTIPAHLEILDLDFFINHYLLSLLTKPLKINIRNTSPKKITVLFIKID